MLKRLPKWLLILIAVFTPTTLAWAEAETTNLVTLDATGRTLSVPTTWRSGPITFRVVGAKTNCEKLWMIYAWRDDVVEPEPLYSDELSAGRAATTKPLTGCKDGVTEVKVDRETPDRRMLTYTLLERDFVDPRKDTRQGIEKELETHRALFDVKKQVVITALTEDTHTKLLAALDLAAGQLDTATKGRTDTIAANARTLKGLEADAALFTGTSETSGIQRLNAILAEVRNARVALETVQDDQKRDERSLKVLQTLRKSVVDNKVALITSVQSCGFGKVLKIGGLLPGVLARTVYYNFVSSPAPPGVALVLMGAYPRIVQDNQLFAVITNRTTAQHKYPFVLSATKVTTAPPILAPVRPTFDVARPVVPTDRPAKVLKAADPKDETKTCAADVDGASIDTAFRDSILPFQERFAGNEVLTVSIATYIPQIAVDKVTTKVENGETKTSKETVVESKVVDLIDSVKYPQVRALYRFNFATGAIVSSLRDPSFVRVKTAVNDGATGTVDESRYQLETSDGPGRVFPAFLFSTYLKRVDIQEPVWIRCGRGRCPGWRTLPAPSLGFSISNPADNVFVGVTSEIIENVHVFVGRHNGKVSELVVPRDAAGNVINVERGDQDSADPKTRSRRTWDWSYGVTFNINILSSFFK